MGIITGIEYCDSTVNEVMGCDGCELWNPKQGIFRCYAGRLTQRFAGSAGWPASFDTPELFPGRIVKALKWPDLTGTKREAKPWLNGLPRLIFLDDMSDTFCTSLPAEGWLPPLIPRMAKSPHVWLFLTKRPRRMRRFFEGLGYVPANFWLGTTITSRATLQRVVELGRIKEVDSGALLWLSCEPLLGKVDLLPYLRRQCDHPCQEYFTYGSCQCTEYGGYRVFDWLAVGGESGASPANAEHVRSLRDLAVEAYVPFFFKQWGGKRPGRMLDGREWSQMPMKVLDDLPQRFIYKPGYQYFDPRQR